MSFKYDGYEICRNALSLDLIEYLEVLCQTHEKAATYLTPKTINNKYPHGDGQAPFSFSSYGSLQGDSLLNYMRPMFCRIAEKNLVECYSYWRSYYKGSELKKHTDRVSCEYSATICITKGSHDWPIYFKKLNGEEIEVELNPGDLIFYKGPIISHWRNEYYGTKHVQLFLHYIDAEGKYARTNTFDGRPELALPANFRTDNVITE
jgi:hypothetical protein